VSLQGLAVLLLSGIVGTVLYFLVDAQGDATTNGDLEKASNFGIAVYGFAVPLLFLPTVFILYSSVLVWRRGYIPSLAAKSPRARATRELAFYFLRIVAIFVTVWLPSLVFYFCDYAFDIPWMLYAGGILMNLQPIVTFCVILTKSDAKRYISDLLTMSYLFGRKNAVKNDGARVSVYGFDVADDGGASSTAYNSDAIPIYISDTIPVVNVDCTSVGSAIDNKGADGARDITFDLESNPCPYSSRMIYGSQFARTNSKFANYVHDGDESDKEADRTETEYWVGCQGLNSSGAPSEIKQWASEMSKKGSSSQPRIILSTGEVQSVDSTHDSSKSEVHDVEGGYLATDEKEEKEEEVAFESKSPRKMPSKAKKDQIKLLEKKLWKSEKSIIKAQVESDLKTLMQMESKRLKYQIALVTLLSNEQV